MAETVISLGVALTVGLVWAIRQTGVVPERVLPLLSLGVGSALVWLLGARGADIATVGIMIGLMASGMWSGGKTLISGGTKQE